MELQSPRLHSLWRSRLYEPFDKQYASELLSHAKQAFEYLEKHPEFEFFYEEEQDLGSGPDRKDTDKEDRFWATAELLRTTGDQRYDQYMQDQFSDLFTREELSDWIIRSCSDNGLIITALWVKQVVRRC